MLPLHQAFLGAALLLTIPSLALATAPAPAPPAATTPPPPGAADCIWAAVPAPVHEAVAGAQSIDAVADAIHQFASATDAEMTVANQCKLPADGPDPVDMVGHVVEARTLEIWSGARLKGDYGLTDARLDRAWAHVTPAGRGELAAWFGEGFFTSKTAKLDSLTPMMNDLGLSGDDASTLVAFYAGARALFEFLGGSD